MKKERIYLYIQRIYSHNSLRPIILYRQRKKKAEMIENSNDEKSIIMKNEKAPLVDSKGNPAAGRRAIA